MQVDPRRRPGPGVPTTLTAGAGEDQFASFRSRGRPRVPAMRGNCLRSPGGPFPRDGLSSAGFRRSGIGRLVIGRQVARSKPFRSSAIAVCGADLLGANVRAFVGGSASLPRLAKQRTALREIFERLGLGIGTAARPLDVGVVFCPASSGGIQA